MDAPTLPPTAPSLQRTILRLVQTHDGPIERSKLGLHSRSYDQFNWETVLDDLVARGLITEGAMVRRSNKGGQKRAVIIYYLTEMTADVALDWNPEEMGIESGWPKFAEMDTEAVAAFVQKFPRVIEPVAASA